MAVLDDVDAWLTSGGISDAYLSYLPDADGMTRAVIEAPATSPQQVFKSTTNAISYARLQVLARDADYSVARAACQEILDRIVAIADETISGTQYMSASTINDPFLIQRDDVGRSMLSGSIELTFAR